MSDSDGKIKVVSPYEAAKLVTDWLENTEFAGQKIAPQMMYQYVGAERIPAKRNAEGHWEIDEDDLQNWFDGYVNRKRTLAAKGQQERKTA